MDGEAVREAARERTSHGPDMPRARHPRSLAPIPLQQEWAYGTAFILWLSSAGYSLAELIVHGHRRLFVC